MLQVQVQVTTRHRAKGSGCPSLQPMHKHKGTVMVAMAMAMATGMGTTSEWARARAREMKRATQLPAAAFGWMVLPVRLELLARARTGRQASSGRSTLADLPCTCTQVPLLLRLQPLSRLRRLLPRQAMQMEVTGAPLLPPHPHLQLRRVHRELHGQAASPHTGASL